MSVCNEGIKGIELGVNEIDLDEASEEDCIESGSGNRIYVSKLVSELRERVANLAIDSFEKTDVELSRWLEARNMNVQDAEKMLRESISWREQNGIQNLLEWDPPNYLIEEFPFQMCGFDHDGDTFGVVTWSKWNIENFLQSIPIDRGQTHIRYFWYCLERVKKILKACSTNEKIIKNGTVIIDMEGLALAQFASKEVVEVVLETTRQFEANYPGFLKKAIVVNAPSVFSILFQLMKPFLSATTLGNVEVYGYYDDWRSFLRKLFPNDQLPSRYGGANTSALPYHPSQGDSIMLPKFETGTILGNLELTYVPAGQKLDIPCQIEAQGEKLIWAFQTEYYDISFGIFYKKTENSEEENVVDFCRVDSHVLVQKGTLVCSRIGKYIARFDNTSSWIHPKTLKFKVKKI